MYIRSAACISPWFPLEGTAVDLSAAIAERLSKQNERRTPGGRRLTALEPDYARYIDPKMIRRMSRIVKMGVATAMRCLDGAGKPLPGAIITGTAYGCLGDTGVFLRKMISNNEELLSPTAFIQSTHNTVGAQVALLLKCHSYNNTIVHRAFSLEHSLTEAGMLLAEGTRQVLVGAIDEITDDSFTLLSRFGLYRDSQHGRAAGEGAAFFLLQPDPGENDLARIDFVTTWLDPGADVPSLWSRIGDSLQKAGFSMNRIGLLLDGSDGLLGQYPSQLQHAGYLDCKKLCGEFPTASGFGLWLAASCCRPEGILKDKKSALLFNRSADGHNSLILVSPC